jgi:hypothetical protein
LLSVQLRRGLRSGSMLVGSERPALGNNRRGQRSLYNGNLGLILNTSLSMLGRSR